MSQAQTGPQWIAWLVGNLTFCFVFTFSWISLSWHASTHNVFYMHQTTHKLISQDCVASPADHHAGVLLKISGKHITRLLHHYLFLFFSWPLSNKVLRWNIITIKTMSPAHWCCLSLFSFCLSNLASLSLSVIICFYLSSRAFIHHSSIYSLLNCLVSEVLALGWTIRAWHCLLPLRVLDVCLKTSKQNSRKGKQS